MFLIDVYKVVAYSILGPGAAGQVSVSAALLLMRGYLILRNTISHFGAPLWMHIV
jgi:hypothetical protein